MSLRLHNTLTRTKQDFVPIDPQNVRMYVCGPTVYDLAHIGNARPLIVFDVLFRLLRHIYGEKHVTYVRNITDVDDKINARAAEEGISIRELTERTTKQFHEDVAALGCLPPTFEPRATDYVTRPDAREDMIRLTQKLIDRGNAYVAEGHVLFHVASMPDYGKLSNRSLDDMIAGARVEVAPYKKDPMDFVLWKPSKPGEPSWPSPWGNGRPGWHLECSAMAGALLGDVFDIHGGGIDLVFPHHENEIAQSRCAHGTDVMANYWLHNGFLQVEGEKMSKSLGNFVTVRELRQEWRGHSWPGESLRFNMLRTHYRQPIDWTLESLDESHRTLWAWYERIDGLVSTSEVPEVVIAALEDDLNTPRLIADLHHLFQQREFSRLAAAMRFLGFSGKQANILRVQMMHVIAAGGGAYEVKGGGLSTALRGTFTPGQPLNASIFSEGQVRLMEARAAARARKDFAEADRIRAELDAMGIALKDSKDPKTGEVVTTWEVKR